MRIEWKIGASRPECKTTKACKFKVCGRCFYRKLCEFQGDKSPSPPYTLEDGADTTTELVSGKSSGLIGGMRQEKPMADEKIDINQDKFCGNCEYFVKYGINHGRCQKYKAPVRVDAVCNKCEFYSCEQTQGHKRIS